MCFGVSSAVGSLFTGKILSYVPRFVMMLLNLLLMLSLMIFLLVWDREPNYAVVFIIPILWGICDSIWNIVITSELTICGHLLCSFSLFLGFCPASVGTQVANQLYSTF